jgi:polyhydroxybutyrate depolymerase
VSFDVALSKMKSVFGDETIDDLFRNSLQALGDLDRYGDDIPSSVEFLTEWATRNGCSDTSTEERVTEHVVLLRWDDCPATAPAELYVIEGAGHTWPGSQTHAALEDLLGPTTLEIDATDLMWEFFEQFHL